MVSSQDVFERTDNEREVSLVKSSAIKQYTHQQSAGDRVDNANNIQSLEDGKANLSTPKKQAFKDSHLAHLLAMRRVLQERVAAPVIPTAPILTQDGEGIIWPHTINLIQGQTGTHKSRVAELISSRLISKGGFRGETLGLELGGSPGRAYSVCYVDTERNQQEQFIQAIQKMKERAGYEHSENPAHFDYNSLLDIPRTERLEALRQYLVHIRSEKPGHLIIVLDQLADCVADFNDPKESLLLTDLLNVMVNQQDVTFLCIIHENPGGSKARGHLGTEAANKASTVLQVSFIRPANGDPGSVLQMKYIKRRSGSPNLTFHVQYDAERGDLVRAHGGAVTDALDQRNKTARLPDVIAQLGPILTEPLPITKLRARLAEKLGASGKTVGIRLKTIIDDKMLVPDANGVACCLKREQTGKLVHCRLEP